MLYQGSVRVVSCYIRAVLGWYRVISGQCYGGSRVVSGRYQGGSRVVSCYIKAVLGWYRVISGQC